MTEELNFRQKKFIENYILTGNATESLIKAGYKSRNAGKYSHELLQKPIIQAELGKTRKNMTVHTKLTIDYKLETLYQGIEHYTKSGEFDKAAKLIEVTNKMQGHNAPDRSINTVGLTDNVEMIRKLTEEYLNGS